MGLVASAINGVSSALGGSGISSSSTQGRLQTFLDTFQSQTNRKNIFKLDPYNNFTCKFEFTPDKIDTINTEDFWTRAGKSLVNAGFTAAVNAVDNLTGGLFSGAADMFSGQEDINPFSRKETNKGDAGKYTILNNSAEGIFLKKAKSDNSGKNLFQKASAAVSAQKNDGTYLGWDLTQFVQRINLPNITIPNSENISTILGNFQTTGTLVDVESHEFSIDILNTKLPLIETVFYPWMREVTLPYWSYNQYPYTLGKLTIDLNTHCDVQYIIYGVKPKTVQTYNPSQEFNSNMVRFVTFSFDYMLVKSSGQGQESIVSSITNGLTSLASGILSS